VMRKMEQHGWVSSAWEESESGPQRRVYAITDVGLEALEERVAMFAQRRTCIDKLLEVYEREAKG